MTDRLLPPNASPQEAALEQVTARVESLPVPVRDVWNPNTCPAGLLPWLAWAFGVDFWDSSWSVDAKRAAIKNSLAVKRTKGTPYAVRTAIGALFGGARFTEWQNLLPRGNEYTFRLDLEVTDQPLDQALLYRVVRIAQYTKNLRSHLTEVAVSARTSSALRVAAVTGFGVELTIGPEVGVVGSLRYDGTQRHDGTQQYDGTLNDSPPALLRLDGSWLLDGSQDLDGVRNV